MKPTTQVSDQLDENIIFLYSLPRSGSTLLQRVMATHQEVGTASESWVFLPMVYALRRGQAWSEYGHWTAAAAVSDFVESLPEGMDGYLAAVRSMAGTLFKQRLTPEQRYFIEKTPRNSLIVGELLRAFPSSKHVFLWRNPVSIAGSIVQTFGSGAWNLHKYYVDFFKGLPNLLDTYAEHRTKVHALTYEDLVVRPRETCQSLFSFLGLDYSDHCLESFAEVSLDGRMGDPKRSQFDSISTASLDSGRHMASNPLRRRWMKRYLAWLGAERLSIMGYELDRLADLPNERQRFRQTISDAMRMAYGTLDRRLGLDLLRLRRRRESPDEMMFRIG